jgi:citrate lyase subunit beta / citryl-CoA lyase
MLVDRPEPPVFRSCLYVPGHREDRIARAYASAADAVILDLEDAVPAGAKARAREIVAAVTARPTPKPTYVRVNSMGTGLCEQDVLAVAGAGLTGVRIAKTRDVGEVRRVVALLETAASTATVHVLIESADALRDAFELATASPAVTMIGLGESDLCADLGAEMDSVTMDLGRARIVVASRAAGLINPAQCVHPDPHDLAGLLVTSERGKRLGFVGRMAIHPDQIPIIHRVHTPQPHEVEEAREICATADIAREADQSIVVSPTGRLVGPPMVARARRTLHLAEKLNLSMEAL